MTYKALPLIALLLVSAAHSQPLAELEALESRYDALTDELHTLQGRMLEDLDPRRASPSQGRAATEYKFLTSCGDVLATSSRNVTAMRQVINISQFVRDSTAQSLARPHIDLQAQALARYMNRASAYVEQVLEGPENRQVIAICKRVRDLVRESIPVAERVRPAWALKQ